MTEVELQIKKARLKLAQKKKQEQDSLINSKIGSVDKKADYAIETSKEAKTIAEGSVELSNQALEIAKTTSKQKGEKGDKGDRGDDGYTPIKGVDYFDGKDGKDGKDGESIIGPRGLRGPKGEKGDSIKGEPGKDGKDGSPDTKYEIRDKLADLKGNERLDAKHIKNIDKQIKMSITTSGGGSGGTENTDEKVKVDSDDTAGYLEDKLEAGTNISFTEVAGKKIRINATAGGGGTVNTVVAGDDIDVDSSDPANPIVSLEDDIEVDSVTTDYVDFDTAFAGAMQEGRLAWNSDDGTLQIGMPGGNVNLQIGQEQLIKVKAGENLSNGDVVYISGASGNNPIAMKANADTSTTSIGTIAVATENITSGSNGYVTSFGLVRDINTNGYAEGSELFLDTTDGQFTDTAPSAPHYVVKIGYVLRGHSTEGVILVNIVPIPGARKINTHRMAGATYSRLQDFIDQTASAGWISGGEFSDNGDGSMTVGAGTGLIRETNNSNGNLVFFDWAEDTNVSVTNQQSNYISVDYNSGTPQIISNTTNTANGNTIFNLGLVFREGTDLHFFRNGQRANDPVKNIIQRFNATGNIQLTSGGLVAETGNRYLTVTGATLYGGIRRFLTDAIDTSGTDTFEYYYTDGLGGWQYLSETATQINNTQYDNNGTLTNLTANRYRTDWLYLSNDGDLLVILGTNNDVLGDAQAQTPPTSQPPHISEFSTLIAKVIVQQGDTNLTEVDNLQTTIFSSTGIVIHNDTSGLQGGTTGEYYHLTSAQATVVANTSGTNTGDQDLSGYIEKTDSVDELADVDTTTTAPTRDQVLKWNGTDWVPADYDASFAMTIASFSDNQSSPQLIGSGTWKSAGQISFTASYNNPPPDSASISLSGTGMSGGFPITLSTPYESGSNTAGTSYPSSKDVTATFTLTAYDGATPRTSTQTVLFRNYLRWGVLSKNSGITSSDLLTLSGSELTNDQTQSKSINSGSGQYLVWAYPSSYTSLNANGLIFNGVTCPFESVATVSHTNEAGYTENYKVYASSNANLGNSTLTTSTSSTIINRLYYGITTKTGTYLESDVEGLANSTISNDNTQTWSSVTAGSGEYLLFAFPTRLGIPVFYVGGFAGGFESPETVSVTNINGYTENYYVWRSTNSNLGSTSVETRSS